MESIDFEVGCLTRSLVHEVAEQYGFRIPWSHLLNGPLVRWVCTPYRLLLRNQADMHMLTVYTIEQPKKSGSRQGAGFQSRSRGCRHNTGGRSPQVFLSRSLLWHTAGKIWLAARTKPRLKLSCYHCLKKPQQSTNEDVKSL